jgi:hypothetical protein
MGGPVAILQGSCAAEPHTRAYANSKTAGHEPHAVRLCGGEQRLGRRRMYRREHQRRDIAVREKRIEGQLGAGASLCAPTILPSSIKSQWSGR